MTKALFGTSVVASLAVVIAAIAVFLRQSLPRSYGPFTDLVTFGDSYTDEARLIHFIKNGEAPPVGHVVPETRSLYSGGFVWPRLVVKQLNDVGLYNYAVSGAICSNDLTPIFFDRISDVFPSVQEYQIPAFHRDFSAEAGRKLPYLKPATTLFSLWIGTNDFGSDALLCDKQNVNVTLVDITNCIVDLVQRLHKVGARNLVFMNAVPLHLAPQYASDDREGVTADNHFFRSKNQVLGGNRTAISLRIQHTVTAANQIWRYQLPVVAKELKATRITYFDTFSLLSDIIDHPKDHLSAPYNTTGYRWHCVPNTGCQESYDYDPDHPDGYVWYDELHPSERTNSIIAAEFLKVMRKEESKYLTYYF